MNEQQQAQAAQGNVAAAAQQLHPKMLDAHFSFSGSVVKPFKGRGRTNRRSSDCTGNTLDSPDTDVDMQEDESDDESYDSSDYDDDSSDEEDSDDYSDSSEEEEEEEEKNDLPITFAPKHPNPAAIASAPPQLQQQQQQRQQQQTHVIPPNPAEASAMMTSPREMMIRMMMMQQQQQQQQPHAPVVQQQRQPAFIPPPQEAFLVEEQQDDEESSEEEESSSEDDDEESSTGYSGSGCSSSGNLSMSDLPGAAAAIEQSRWKQARMMMQTTVPVAQVETTTTHTQSCPSPRDDVVMHQVSNHASDEQGQVAQEVDDSAKVAQRIQDFDGEESDSSDEDDNDSEDYDSSSSAYSGLMEDLPMEARQTLPVAMRQTGKAEQALPTPQSMQAPPSSMLAPSQERFMVQGFEEAEEPSSEEDESDSYDDEEGDYSSSGYSDIMADLPIQAKRVVPTRQRVAPGSRAPSSGAEEVSENGFSIRDGDEDEDSSSDSEYTDDEMDTRDSGSYDSSEDWSSSAGSSGYDDLLNDMPIALGRKGAGAAQGQPGLQRFASSREVKPAMPAKGLPVMTKPGLPGLSIPGDEIPCADPPMEGLALLQNIRSELEKVGQLIVKNKEGEKFLQRAQILTSINYLASNVPKCVLEDLGREIRDQLKKEEEKTVRASKSKSVMDSLVAFDDLSEASELSQVDEKSFEDSDPDLVEDDFFPEDRTPETLRRKFNVENFMPLKNRMSIRDSRALSLSTHSAHFQPMLREDEGPVRRATRTYSFASVSSTSSSSMLNEPNLPIVTYFNCALLFVDISGFTKLSTLLDPENLSKVINTYFEVRLLATQRIA